MFKIVLIFGFLLLTTGVSIVERTETDVKEDAGVEDQGVVKDEEVVKDEAGLEHEDNVGDESDSSISQGKFSFYSSNYKNDNGTESGEQTAVSGDTEDGKVDSSSVEVSHKTLKDGEVTVDTEADAQKALEEMAKSGNTMEQLFEEFRETEKKMNDMFGDFFGDMKNIFGGKNQES